MRRTRVVEVTLPTEVGATPSGLAYSLWLPERARGGVIILHGAGSAKESHHDFARLLLASGIAAVAFDARGHGASAGAMDGGAIDDLAEIAAVLRAHIGDAPVILRGSSMGGYLALIAAGPLSARGVVAICPASGEGLRRGLERDTLGFRADRPALDAFLAEHDIGAAVEALDAPVLLLHAEGDEIVPVEHSRELAARMRHPRSRLIAVPGGHHRSVQHDEELQAVSLRWIQNIL